MPTSASPFQETRSWAYLLFHTQNYSFTILFSEGKQVKNEQRIKGFKSTDSSCLQVSRKRVETDS
nr:MAG TPA: hypothetical protein [Caudoviricetes sp.]